MSYNIVIIDPDKSHMAVIKKTLEYVPREYQFHFLNSPLEVIQMLETEHIDVLISEMNTPVISGLEIFRMCEIMASETEKMLLTDASDIPKVLEIINEVKIFRIVIKPCKLAEDIMLPVNQALKKREETEKERLKITECNNSIRALDDKYQVLKRAYQKNAADFQMINQIIAGALKGNIQNIAGEDKHVSLEEYLQKIFLWYILVNYSDCKGYAAKLEAFIANFHQPDKKKMVILDDQEALNCKTDEINRIFYGLYLLTGLYDVLYQNYQVHISVKEHSKTVEVNYQFVQDSSQSDNGVMVYRCKDEAERDKVQKIAREILSSMMNKVEYQQDDMYEIWILSWVKL